MLRTTLTLLRRGLLATTIGIAGVVGLAAAPSFADGGLTGGGGGANSPITVTVTYTGNAAPSGGGSASAGVPATCWWQVADLSAFIGGELEPVDPNDPEALEAYYDSVRPFLTGHAAGGAVELGDWEQWKKGIKRMLTDPSVKIYHAECRSNAPECAKTKYLGGENATGYYGPSDHTGDCGLAMAYAFYAPGDVPDPYVDPEDLAQAARDAMNIPNPDVDRNPKSSATGGATLVSLPTWFWVTDPRAVGGNDGERNIRASVPAGAWAEVTAETGGLSLTSPAGGQQCSPSAAQYEYRAGRSEAAACTVDFRRASVGYANGFPVEARTAWDLTWVGNDGYGGANVGGGLPGLGRAAAANVPVAESQSLVTGTR